MEQTQIDLADEFAKLKVAFEKQERELNLQKELILQKDAVILDMEERSVFQYFQDNKSLPELRQDGTTTGPSTNVKHQPISELVECDFGLIEVKEKHLLNGKRRTTKMFEEKRLGFSTEKDVEDFCKVVIEDMIYTADLTNSLCLRGDLSIAELKADFWIISYNGFPIGAVEIKKPEIEKKRHHSSANDRKMKINYGQLFDYLMRIRSFHGVPFVFGIFSNFREWRICWLPDSDSLALASSLESLNMQESIMDEKIAEKRVLHVSRIYSWQNVKSIACALYSVLLKMNASADHIQPVPLISPTRSYIVLNQLSWEWNSGLKLAQLTFSMSSITTSKRFYLLRDFHGGADGRVWLACCQRSGALVVIKFQSRIREGKSGTELQRAEKEVSYWRKVGFSTVYHTKLTDRHAIIMPFGFHFKENENGEVEIDNKWWKSNSLSNESLPVKDFDTIFPKVLSFNHQEALEKCIDLFSSKKLVHDDIEWRHVALFPQYQGIFRRRLILKPCFIDLSRITEKETVDQAKLEMSIEMKRLMNN